MDHEYEGYVGEAEEGEEGEEVDQVCENCLYWSPINAWTMGPPRGCRAPVLDPKDPEYSDTTHTGPRYGCVHFIEWR